MPRPYTPLPHRDLFSDEDLTRFTDSCVRFTEAVKANEAVARQAEHAVAMTMSWVGVGEKLLAVTKTVVDHELSKPKQAAATTHRLAGIQGKITELTSLATSLRSLLSGMKT